MISGGEDRLGLGVDQRKQTHLEQKVGRQVIVIPWLFILL